MLGKKTKPKRPSKFVNWIKNPKNKYKTIILLGVLVIVIDSAFIADHIYQTHKRNNFIKQQTSALGTQNVPSSVKPTAKEIAAYSVPPTNPKYIIIPAINVYARVAKLYTNSQNQIEAPNNIYDAGWYYSSSLPGQPGAMFIDGHVSSWTADGVFYNLKNLKPGDTIQIIRGDNTSFTYTVAKLVVYKNTSVDMTQALAPINPAKPGLNIMTCTGSVISGTSEFNERVVVYSVLQS